MRTLFNRIGTSILFIALGVCGVQAASHTLALAPGSALSLTGDSTLHPFTCRTTTMTVTGDISSPDLLQAGALRAMKLTIPVKNLKSHEAALDKNMYKALNAETHPEIIFELTSYTLQPSTRAASAMSISLKGVLQIVGVQKPIAFQAEAVPEAQGVHVQGEYTLLMLDYGIKPPTMMMGAIKVRNPVTIHFDIHLVSISG